MAKPDTSAVGMPERSMNHQWQGDVIYCFHRRALPDNADWDAFLDTVAHNVRPNDKVRVLVNTEAAGPNAAQRQRMNELMNGLGSKLRVAVLTESVLARGIIQALSWMKPMVTTPTSWK